MRPCSIGWQGDCPDPLVAVRIGGPVLAVEVTLHCQDPSIAVWDQVLVSPSGSSGTPNCVMMIGTTSVPSVRSSQSVAMTSPSTGVPPTVGSRGTDPPPEYC